MSQAPHKCLAKSPRLSVQGLGLNLSAIVVSDPLDSRLSSRSDQIPHRFRPGETSSSSARPAHSFRRAPLFARAQNDQGPEADVPKPQILSEDELRKLGDPERVYRQYGRRFGGGYRIPTDWRESDWIRDAPQVRFRNASDKAKEQLYELAIVNARLAGKARTTVECTISEFFIYSPLLECPSIDLCIKWYPVCGLLVYSCTTDRSPGKFVSALSTCA